MGEVIIHGTRTELQIIVVFSDTPWIHSDTAPAPSGLRGPVAAQELEALLRLVLEQAVQDLLGHVTVEQRDLRVPPRAECWKGRRVEQDLRPAAPDRQAF